MFSLSRKKSGDKVSAPKQWRSRYLRPIWRRMRGRKPAGSPVPKILIDVFAGFCRMDGNVDESEVDTTLSVFRYDYPAGVYEELRKNFTEALGRDQDLKSIAELLAEQMTLEDKILLGVQLFVMISRTENTTHHLTEFYRFMTDLGVAAEAIDIVYQLHTDDLDKPLPDHNLNSQRLESLHIGMSLDADVELPDQERNFSLHAFRFQNLVLLKNSGNEMGLARGRRLEPGDFCRLYAGQMVVLGDYVIRYEDLIYYFNAKKNLVSTEVYLNLTKDKQVVIEREQTRQSCLEIKFGLGVTVRALQDTQARLRGVRLREGFTVVARTSDVLELSEHSEMLLSEIMRRARELGGRFSLTPSRNEYLVSNNPALLSAGDILLSPGKGSEVLFRIYCNFLKKTGELEVLRAERPPLLHGQAIKTKAKLQDGDTIEIFSDQFLRCDFSDKIIEEERNSIQKIFVSDISHFFRPDSSALDSLNIEARRGEMICVIGPSGCGKSTLLRCLAGHLNPFAGNIYLNGLDFYENHDLLAPYIAFMPHEEAFDPLLTVEQNITYSAAIRSPHLNHTELRRRVGAKLTELGLYEQRNRMAGEPSDKFLSGGERKRLNISLDVLSAADVFLFDEPTSGLSSKDSEHVMEIIRGMSHNKIVFVSIHQPSARLFRMFNKVVLLDQGGVLAFTGTPEEALKYFRTAHDEELTKSAGIGRLLRDSDPTPEQPDFIFDVMETPLKDLSGDVIYEEDDRGHLLPARRFSPGFWRDRFQAHRLVQQVKQAQVSHNKPSQNSATAIKPEARYLSVTQEWRQFSTLFRRSFYSKLRNRANITTTLFEAPALAFLIAFALRFSETDEYTFADSFHIPTWLFLSLVVALFLGLTNSANEITRDRPQLQRERNHSVRIFYYLLAKILTLSAFALAQTIIYLLIGNYILGINEMFFSQAFWMFTTACIGIVTGLLISAIVRDAKVALNLIPIALIPQIILGGALIKYEEMNRNLDFIYSFAQKAAARIDENPNDAIDHTRFQVPLLCQFIPLRWSYEATIINQSEYNPLSNAMNHVQSEINSLKEIPDFTIQQKRYFNQLKQSLPFIQTVSGDNHSDIKHQIRLILKKLRQHDFLPDDFEHISQGAITAQSIYQNQKVKDLVQNAENIRLDRRHQDAGTPPPNVFFATKKNFQGHEISTLLLNFLVLLLFIIFHAILVYLVLLRELSKT